MEGNVKISIIIPVYNVEKYIERCIDSVLNQTLKDIEIILVDDGSPDNSGIICDNYAKKDNRIKVIHKKNAGLGYARNSGIEIAKGEFVGFVDSDDYVETTMFEKLYNKAFQENADTCLCNIKNISGTYRDEEVIKEILPRLIGGNDCIGMSVWKGIYSKKLIDNNSIRFVSEREFISEDIMFDLNYYRYSKCVSIINEKLYYYTVNTSSLSRKYKEDRFDMCSKLYDEEKKILKEMNIYDSTIQRLNNTYLWNINSCIIQEIVHEKDNGKNKCDNNIKKILKNIDFINDIETQKMRMSDKILVYILKMKSLFLIKWFEKIKIKIKVKK